MRIFRKSPDYYDIGLSRGHDDRIMYVRQQKVIGPNPQESSYRYPASGGSYVTDEIIIGFCGKIYPLVVMKFFNNSDGEVTEYYCYNVNELTDVYKRHGITVRDNGVMSFCQNSRAINFLKTGKINERFNNTYKGNLTDIFINNRVPIFHVIGQQVTLNPILKNLRFFRVFDAYTAYQEIEMYIGGVLGMIGKDIPEVSDEDRYAAHGFNKESFRMPAGRKKPRRRGK